MAKKRKRRRQKNEVGHKLKIFFKNAFQCIAGENFESKCGAKQKAVEQSVARWTIVKD